MTDESTGGHRPPRSIEEAVNELVAKYAAHEFLLEYLFVAAFARLPTAAAAAEVDKMMFISRGLYGVDATDTAEDIEWRRTAARVHFNVEAFATRILARRKNIAPETRQ